MASTLRPTAEVRGFYVTTVATAYDMRDQGGQAGTSYRAYFVEVDDKGVHSGVHGLKVPADLVPTIVKLQLGQPVVVEAIGFTQMRRNQAVVEWQIGRVIDAKSGEVIAERRRAA